MLVNRSLRFKILTRDEFTCQWCGKKAPEVELEVDHIIPVSKGGIDKEWNLVAACIPCNQSKKARLLSANIITERHMEWFRKFAPKVIKFLDGLASDMRSKLPADTPQDTIVFCAVMQLLEFLEETDQKMFVQLRVVMTPFLSEYAEKHKDENEDAASASENS